MNNIAFFDFDGTITSTDSYTPFIFQTIPASRMKKGKFLLAPYILGYRLNLIRGTVLRSKIFKLGFAGLDANELQQKGLSFSQSYLPQIIRPQALKRIQWHLAQGDRVVVVSASMDVYLKPWCAQYGLDLLCSEVDAIDGKITGIYKNGDCSREVKKQRILDNYDLSLYAAIYAYGDTIEDHEMLSLATHAFYRWQPIHHNSL
ncbi:HAD family hydrolase [uncultured Acinetobacter sp.]|uniref:HAD family hydrolase n=1 Tax=uncultured Acinetobacter sp. TaxID=165433 RepID=UPI00258C2F9A|nr:HAD family hydrolase [uncultured Acinetobacter sp.]